MPKLLSLLAGTVLLSSAFSTSLPAQAASPELMPHTELKRGMQGQCRTVFQGNTIEPFQFEVIDVLHNHLGPKRDLILARLQGDKATYTGVVAGMSGSPCYINNKLIGALSYRFGTFTKEPIAGITPIQDMLSLFEIPERNVKTASEPLVPSKYSDVLAHLQSQHMPTELKGQNTSLQTIATPLSFSGFDPKVIAFFKSDLNKLGFEPMMGSSSGSKAGHPEAPEKLEMGGAIAGQLVRGDMSISGTGTVSYVDGNKVLAFGHPFFNTGHVRIPMATAYIQHIMVSETGSYKMAEDGREVGTITQDRLTAISGLVGDFSPMIPVELSIQDTAKVDPQSLRFEVFKDPQMTPMMMAMSVYNSLNSRLQFNNGGNLSVKGTLKANGKEIPINRFYSTTENGDTPSMAAQALAQDLFTLWNNPFQSAEIESLKLNFQFHPQTLVSKLDEVWPAQIEVRPGETVKLNARIKAYRGNSQVEALNVKIPDDTPYGPLLMMVSGGPELDALEDSLKPGYHNYQALLDDLAQSRDNDKIYVKVISDQMGAVVDSQLYPKLPLSVVEHLDLPANYSHLMPLLRSPGAEFSYPVSQDLSGQFFVRIWVTPRGRVIN